jgi:hypothetical protein
MPVWTFTRTAHLISTTVNTWEVQSDGNGGRTIADVTVAHASYQIRLIAWTYRQTEKVPGGRTLHITARGLETFQNYNESISISAPRRCGTTRRA